MARESRTPLVLVRALLVLLAAALAPSALKAGDNTWTSIGPFAAGGDVRTIAVDPVSPGTLYVGTDGGVFKSLDGGTSWGAVNAGITAFTVYAIVIDPTASGTLYAGTNAGIFKTVNGGSSWTSDQTGLGLATVQSIAVDPTSPNVVYVGTTGSGVSKSVDGGVTWTGSSNGLRNFDVRTITIDPSSSSTLYAGTAQGVFKSTDGAASWSATPGLQTGVRVLAIDQATPSTIYAGTEGLFTTTGVFKSSDAGATWAASDAGLGNLPIFSLAMVPGQPATLYAGSQGGGLFVTHDAGTSWTSLPGSPSTVNAVSLDTSGRVVYAGTPEGFYRSSDQGQTWVAQNIAFTTLTVSALLVDPASATTLYAGVGRPGSSGGGIYKTTNAGATWFASGGGLPDRVVKALAASSQTPATLFAGTGDSGVFVSRDGGATWAASNTGLTSLGVNSLAVGGSATVYAGTNAGVFRSTDLGATWTDVSAGLTASSVQALAVDPTRPEVVYAGTPAGVFKSIDGGDDWVHSTGGLTNTGVLSLVIDPTAPATIYAGTFSAVTTGTLSGSGVYRSTDAGATWSPDNMGIETLAVTALATDPTGGTVFAGTTEGVYRSSRGSTTWTGVNEGLSLQVVSSLAIDPALPARVYAGTLRNSVFQIVFRSGAGSCTAGPLTLCLNGNRFQVEVDWHAPLIGTSGVGTAIPLTSDTGAFWFFSSGNVELVIKVVDGRTFDQSFWVFYGAMSDVAYTITVTDTLTAAKKVYENPQGRLASIADTSAFPAGSSGSSLAKSPQAPESSASSSAFASRSLGRSPQAIEDGPCVADATTLCLNANRFRVVVQWHAVNIGQAGVGQAVSLSSDSGSFWFFTSGNLELNIKVVDGRAVNNHFWVFFGALSDVEYTITVTDMDTGAQQTYTNPQGQLASVADTSAF